MKTLGTSRGISAVVIVVILAVIAVGGVATVSYMQRADVNMSTEEAEMQAEEEVAEAKSDAREDLLGLRTALEGSVDVDTTLRALGQIRSDLTEAYVNADAEMQAEMRALENRFDTLEAEIRAQSDNARNTISEIVASLEAGADMEMDAEGEATTTDDDADASATTSVDVDASADTTSDDGTGTDADVDAEGSGSFDLY